MMIIVLNKSIAGRLLQTFFELPKQETLPIACISLPAKIIVICSNKGVYSNIDQIYAKRLGAYPSESLIQYLKELFIDLDHRIKQSLTELHLVFTQSDPVLVKNLSYNEIDKIKKLFPSLKKVVGVTGVIDQKTLLYKGMLLTVEGKVLGKFEDIISNGLINDKVNKTLVQEFYIL